LEKVLGDPKEFLLEDPNDREPPNDRDPNERPPLPPKLPLASAVNGIMMKESIAVMNTIYACFKNVFIGYLKI